MNQSIAGVVVLYNPNEKVYENISKYCEGLEKLYVYDNSPLRNEWLYAKLTANCEVIKDGGGNDGIAKAYNKAAVKAKKDGFKWLLTMDQDSFYTKNMLEKLKKVIEKTLDENTVIIAPIIDGRPVKDKKEIIEYAISSGSLVCLDILEKIGGFDEDYFIYMVDVEICKRASFAGYNVLQIYDIVLNHQTNDKIDNKHSRQTNPLAYYYAIRNSLYYYHKYPEKSRIETLRKIVHKYKFWYGFGIRENRRDIAIKYMFRGTIGYLLGERGKYKGYLHGKKE